MDWLQNPAATDGAFTSRKTFDALNRPLTVTSPDQSVYRPTFNEANLLDKVDVHLRGAAAGTAFVTNIDYNAKGQRERIEYGNGAATTYEYDPLTFRLSRLRTTRPANPDATASQLFLDPSVVQDLRYSYDPVGNLTRIEDAALKTIIHGGQSVEPVSAFTYDAVYRLIEAVGREHIGQNAYDFSPPTGDYRDHPFAGNRAHPNDLQALRNYTERYEYDPVGNFEVFRHRFNGGGWTRSYEYGEASLLEAGKTSNRLTRTMVGNGISQVEPYTHDVHGNVTSMPHLAAMVWGFKDELQQVDMGGGGTAYYVYDSAGQRVRKVIETQTGARQKERLYLGGFEFYREYTSSGVSLERESLHVADDQQRIALVETQTVENVGPVSVPIPILRYQLGNHLGSSAGELDDRGALIAYEEYHPYGTTAFQAGRSAAEVSLKRYRYTGKERDEETGFYYHGARYYASWLGRWTTADPAGLEDGPNLYVYVSDNPAILVDPNGKAGVRALIDQMANRAIANNSDLQMAGAAALGALWTFADFASAGTVSKIDAIHDRESAGDRRYQGENGVANYVADVSREVGIGSTKIAASAVGGALLSKVAPAATPLMRVLQGAAGGAAAAGGVDVTVQSVEMVTGAREEFSAEQTASSMAQSALWGAAGAAAGEVAEGVGGYLKRILKDETGAVGDVAAARKVAGQVRPGDTGTYGELNAQRRAHGQSEPLHLDHQPSFAASALLQNRRLGVR